MSTEPPAGDAGMETPDAETTKASVRASGDRTIQQYQNWMQINAASHLLRAARQCGLIELLQQGQQTLEQVCDRLSLDPESAEPYLACLTSIGIVEQYGEDYALARAGHLLCQYDQDLGDARWENLGEKMQPRQPEPDPGKLAQYRSRLAATQWIHTSAALQAAEILDVANPKHAEWRLLDLGCGAGVWSCAIAHQVPGSTVLAVDQAELLQSAQETANSIELGERYETLAENPITAELPGDAFDLAVLPQLVSCLDDQTAAGLLKSVFAALKAGGRVAIPDLYVGPAKAGLKESLGRLEVSVCTPHGKVRDLRDCDKLLRDAGFTGIQFSYLVASEQGLGMLVAEK
ncbi:hypothetical protein SV7mr_45370 [Stieleria bergensis]|uniref:O-methyltransferase C-terminal domain-containing protein n=1 Tax=Stieleria bergensis TaxID=2528025 RepID=A0A517T0S7_9BACT|nr:hypothetical protein SV7mr_45370 [Planctomycetes bacterium SV_7m_r]